MKTIIEDKLKTPQSEGYEDAFDYILSSANENNHNITIQELQVKLKRHVIVCEANYRPEFISIAIFKLYDVR